MPKAPYIIHVSTPVSWRGGEQQALYLIRELADRGIGQELITTNGSIFSERAREHCDVILSAKRRVLGFRLAWRIARRVRDLSGEYDVVVHTHDSHGHGAAILAATLFACNAPIVVSRRVDFSVGSSWFSVFKYNHPSVRRILCVSDCVREIVAVHVKDTTKLFTVYDGVSLHIGTSRNGLLREMIGISSSTPLVVAVAALTPSKDVLTFVRVAAELRRRGSIAHFAIMGTGTEYSLICEELNTLNLHHCVHMLGFRSDVHQLLPDADVLLCTPLTEGLGSSILDAMVCNVAVVATNVGGIPEIVTHEFNGLLAQAQDVHRLADHVASILDNNDLRTSLIRNAHSVVQALNTHTMASRTLEHYRTVLAEP